MTSDRLRFVDTIESIGNDSMIGNEWKSLGIQISMLQARERISSSHQLVIDTFI